MNRALATVALCALVACRGPIDGAGGAASLRQRVTAMDIHSHAEPNKVRARHVSLDLTLDFARKQVRGTAAVSFDRLDPTAPLVLDGTALVIEAVTGEDGGSRTWQVGPEDPNIGAAITIALAPGDRQVKVAYHSTEKAAALQWLAPE